MIPRLTRIFSPAALLLVLGACGGTKPTAPQYTVGGNVINLAGSDGGLELGYSFGAQFPIEANGAFRLLMPLASGASYAVTVIQQPSNPSQVCGVTNGTGVATANVTNIVVDCSHNEWTWVSGATMTNVGGVYGTVGVPAATNYPGARQYGATWTDSSGALWLFGGYGYDPPGNLLPLNDLWKFANGQWTWVGGPDVAGKSGVYGERGFAAPGNIPGSRYFPVTWKDSSGAFWVFGGLGFDSQGQEGELGDLWKYSGGEWTWVSGSNQIQNAGIYGTKGLPAAGNMPGARTNSSAWTDASGNFWLFGGEGYAANGARGALNDLWEFHNGQWVWIAGSNLVNQSSTWAAPGVSAPANAPGGRSNMLSWTDVSGNFWLYGGVGWGAPGVNAFFNDLWEFSSGQWALVSGSELASQIPTAYGVKGVASATNSPGWRQSSAAWTDSAGNLWLFGGNATDVTGQAGLLSDLWKYSNGQWTWMAGPNISAQNSVYGTQSVPMPGNIPGGRMDSSVWVDGNGNFWLLGGYGSAQSGSQGDLNDLWMYKP
jgi:N-acetylneuraminic acid mutarotase